MTLDNLERPFRTVDMWWWQWWWIQCWWYVYTVIQQQQLRWTRQLYTESTPVPLLVLWSLCPQSVDITESQFHIVETLQRLSLAMVLPTFQAARSLRRRWSIGLAHPVTHPLNHLVITSMIISLHLPRWLRLLYWQMFCATGGVMFSCCMSVCAFMRLCLHRPRCCFPVFCVDVFSPNFCC